MNFETKQCQNCNKEFKIDSDDFEFYEKIKVPTPKLCFFCRLQKRLAFWLFGKFNRRKCDFSKENIISIHSHKTRFPVFKATYWYSDQWQPPQMDYNFSCSFFDQLYNLQIKTPKPHQFGTNNLDCDYCDDVWDSKNCYLCRSMANCENLSYSYRTVRCRDSYDLSYCFDSEQSYDCSYLFKIYNVQYAFNVKNSIDSAFLYDCHNVNNCFMCWNLRNKGYYILNKPYSKEEYFQKLKEYNLGSWNIIQFLKKEFQKHIQQNAIHRVDVNSKIIQSSGNYLSECKRCRSSYFLENSENCAYCFRGPGGNKDAYDATGIWKGELIYDVNQLTQGYNLKYSNYCTNCCDSEYLDFCVNCENCFGCVGLKNGHYCILNKPYNKEEYEKLIKSIKDSMMTEGVYGDFFPYKMAYGGYNLSLAGVFFPKTKEEINKMGALWEDIEETNTNIDIAPFIDDITMVKDDVLQKALICEESNRPFNLRKDELEFFRKHVIPLPHN